MQSLPIYNSLSRIGNFENQPQWKIERSDFAFFSKTKKDKFVTIPTFAVHSVENTTSKGMYLFFFLLSMIF